MSVEMYPLHVLVPSTSGFLMFSCGIEKDQWYEMDLSVNLQTYKHSKRNKVRMGKL